MRKKAVKAIRFLCGALLIVGVVSIISLLMASVSHKGMMGVFLLYLLILVPYTVSKIAIRKCHTIAPFLFFSVASSIIILFYPFTTGETVVLALLCLVIIIIRMAARLREKEHDALSVPKIPALFLFVILYIVGTSQSNVFFAQLNYYLAFAYAILLIIFYNFSNLDNYLEINKAVQNIPDTQISRTNYGLLALYLFLTILAMIILPIIGLDQVIASFGQAILALIRAIVAMGSRTPSASTAESESPSQEAPDNEGGFFAEETPTPEWLTNLYEALAKFLVIVIALLLVAGLIYLIVLLIRRFSRSYTSDVDTAEFIPAQDDKASSIMPPLREIFKRPEWLDFSPNATVRKLYRKTIEKASHTSPEESLTPEEIEDFVKLPKTQENAQLHELYEKARYSENGITKDEAKSLK